MIIPSFSFAQISGLNGWNIFIDPGHSQTDNMGVNGYSEAEEVLRVGLHLQDILLNQTDIDTAYISRTNDQQQVSLYQRTNQANSLGASWYHSIHSNAGASDHNNTLLLWGQLYNGNPDPPVGGEEMSNYMIDVLTRTMRIPTIGSWGDCSFYTWSTYCEDSGGPYLYVNRNTNMPSELSEEGHHTNPPQNQLYMNEEYKRMLAYSFYWSILEYHEIDRPYVGICAGIVSDVESGQSINGANIDIGGMTYTTDTYESLFNIYSNDPNELRNGYYFFEGLPDTTLDIIVSADHYYSDTTSVSILDTFITFHDVELLSSLPSTIVETIPVQGDSLFPAWQDIIINFSRPIDVSTIDSAIIFNPSVNYNPQWSDNNKRLTLTPDSLEFETWYSLSILDSSIRDVYGHIFDGDADTTAGGEFELNFKTGPPDMEAPYIVKVYPENIDQHIELSPIINMQFNEVVGPDSILEDLFYLERFLDHSYVEGITEHYIVNTQSVFNFFPNEQLYPNETYVTRLSPGLEDEFHNEMNSAHSFSFQTGSVDFDNMLIDNFESNMTSNWWSPEMSGSTTGIIPDSTSMSVDNVIVNHVTNSTKSMKINYGWDVNTDSWLIREYLSGGAPRNVQFTKDHLLQVYIFGDDSRSKFRFCVDDNVPNSSAGNHEVSPWIIIDWIGWKLVNWDMVNDGTGTWIGDGNLDGNLRIDSFQLTYGENNSQFGTLYFDDLRITDLVNVSIENENFIPDKISFFPNYPNPFNPSTTISYSIPDDNLVKIRIINILGRQIKTLSNSFQTEGTHSIIWDGKNEHDMQMSSGIYFVLLEVGEERLSHKIILAK